MLFPRNSWSTLLDKIEIRECVPFIGAGANFPYLPLGGQLAGELLKLHERGGGEKCTLKDEYKSDLIRVAQYLAVVGGDSKRPKQLVCDIINRGPAPETTPDEPHEVLASLELPLYITTNYDDNMKKALERRGKEVTVRVCRWNERIQKPAPDDPNYRADYRPDKDHPMVFHLHGRANDVESVVVTEEDYLDFLAKMSSGLNNWESTMRNSQPDRGPKVLPATARTDDRIWQESGVRSSELIPSVVLSALMSDNLMFIGYGLADMNLKVILRAIANVRGARHWFGATVQHNSNLFASQQYIDGYFKFMLNLFVYWGASRMFTRHLRKRRHVRDVRRARG